MDWETVTLEYDDAIATLTVDRPDQLNALDVPTLEALGEAIDTAVDDEARVLVVRGAGDRAFVAGGDIAYMQDLSTPEAEELSALGHAVSDRLATAPIPTIAGIDGYALGGGCELAVACDFRVATPDALIGTTEIDLGIMPGWGATQRLPTIVGDAMARRMIFLGEQLDAETALEHGLVGEVVPDEDFEDRLDTLASDLAAKPHFALQTAKAAINQAGTGSREAGLEYERRAFAGLFGTADQREGMAAFLADREPNFE